MQTDQIERRLINDYFGMTRLEWNDEVDFQLPYGEWLRLFRGAGFSVETRPGAGAASSFLSEAETG